MEYGKLYISKKDEFARFDYLDALFADDDEPIYVNCGNCQSMKQFGKAIDLLDDDLKVTNYVCSDCEIGSRAECDECHHSVKFGIEICKCRHNICGWCLKKVTLPHIHYPNDYAHFYLKLINKGITLRDLPEHFITRKMLSIVVLVDSDCSLYIERINPSFMLKIMSDHLPNVTPQELQLYKEFCRKYVSTYHDMSKIDKKYYSDDEYYDLCILTMKTMTSSIATIKHKFSRIIEVYEEAIKRPDFSLGFVNSSLITEAQLRILILQALKINYKLIVEITIPTYDQYLIVINRSLNLSYVNANLLAKEDYYRLCRIAINKFAPNLMYVQRDHLNSTELTALCRLAIVNDILRSSKLKDINKIMLSLKYLHKFNLDKPIYLKLCETVFNYNALALNHIVPNLYYYEVCCLAIKKNPESLKYVNHFCLTQKEYCQLCIKATNIDYKTYEFVNRFGIGEDNFNNLSINISNKSDSGFKFVKSVLKSNIE